MLANLSGKVNEMEGKLCRCHEVDVEVEDDDDPTSELSYETVYHTLVAIVGLLEDVLNWLVPIGDLEVTPGGFKEEVRDGDTDSDQELESVLESVHTVLTQPGTPVSFRGMYIYLLLDFRKLRNFRCFPFPENSGTPTFPISRNSGL